MIAIGLDLGGTNIKGLAVSVSGRVLAERMSSTESTGSRSWLKNVDKVLADLRSGWRRRFRLSAWRHPASLRPIIVR
jgi:predicted NBD/HSP70 family sugar kinase